MAAQLSNAELADMHLAYGAANGNARQAARLYQERFPNRYLPGHRMFTSIHRRLRERGSFTGRMTVAGRPTMAQIGQKLAKIIKIVVSRGYEELVPRYELHTIQ